MSKTRDNMPHLSDKLIENTGPLDKVFFLWDSEIKGLGVKITPSGGKTFVFQWQQTSPKPSSKRRKIGNCCDLKVSDARHIAKTARNKIRDHQEEKNDQGIFNAARGLTREKKPSAKQKAQTEPESDLIVLETELLHYFDSAGISTRDKIVSVATKAFINEGFDATLETIAQKSGYTRLTIYRYFDNKEALVDAVINEVETRFFEIDPHPIDFSAPPQEALIEFATKFRRNSLSEQNISFYRLLNNVSKEKSLNLFERVVASSHRHSIKSVAEYFDHLAEEGQLRSVNNKFLAEQFLSAIPGFDRSRVQKGLPIKSAKDETQYIAQLVDTFLLGLVCP